MPGTKPRAEFISDELSAFVSADRPGGAGGGFDAGTLLSPAGLIDGLERGAVFWGIERCTAGGLIGKRAYCKEEAFKLRMN